MPGRPRRLPAYLEEAELRALLAVARASLRDYTFVLTLVYAGLRVSEACSLAWLDLTETRLLVRRGKGSKQRLIPLHHRLRTALDEWRDFGLCRHQWVFPGRGRGHFAIRSAEHLIVRLCARAGIAREKAHPHTLRHTAATNLLRQTGNLILVQRFLGHASVSTTQIYTHLVLDDLADAIGRLD